MVDRADVRPPISDRLRGLVLGEPQAREHKLFKYNGEVFSSQMDSLGELFERVDITPEARVIETRSSRWNRWKMTEIFDSKGNLLDPPTAGTLVLYMREREGMRSGPMIYDPNGISRELLRVFLEHTNATREGICYEAPKANHPYDVTSPAV